MWLQRIKSLFETFFCYVFFPGLLEILRYNSSACFWIDVAFWAPILIDKSFFVPNRLTCSCHFQFLLYFNQRNLKSRAADPNRFDNNLCDWTSHALINAAANFWPCHVSGSGGKPMTESRTTAASNCWSACCFAAATRRCSASALAAALNSAGLARLTN